MPIVTRRAAVTALALLPIAACSPLSAFDALTPKDGGGRRVAADVPYGGGPRRRLDVYAPDAPGPHPVILFCYGGSWSSGSKDDYAFAGRAFAAEGFVTVVPDYRLVPEVVFPAFVEDVAAAVRWTRDHAADAGGDPDRIVLVGHSAGAYTVAMLGLDDTFLKAAGVPRRAVRGVAGLAGPYDFYPFDVDASRDAFGSAPDPRATQPVNHVDGGAPPFLLLTGEDDETVRPRNSRELAARLKAVGGSATLVSYPGIDHAGILLALSRLRRDTAPVLSDVVAFARRVTR